MTKVERLIDELSKEICHDHKDGVCDWCGSDTREKPNQLIYEYDWRIGEEGRSVHICTTCKMMTERAHVGQKISNPDHPRYGHPMERIDTKFMGKSTMMCFDGYEEELAALMIKRIQKRAKMAA